LNGTVFEVKEVWSLFEANGRGGMQSQYPLLSMEAVRIGWGAHDEANLAVEDVSFQGLMVGSWV
jgi:hypothetical protein